MSLRRIVALSCLVVFAVPAVGEDQDLRKQVEELKKQLKTVEDKIDANNKSPAKTQAPPAAPMSDYDFTWLNGNSRVTKPLIDNDWFTSQFMVDVNYTYDWNHPKDHTIDGASEINRHNELQLQQLGLGGDLHYNNIRGRLITQFGQYSQVTPRNDASPARGQWLNGGNGYQYLAEAYGGYHWDRMYGVNVDAGLFMSYVGLFSYYQNENWAYTPSYVSANTPWFFNGVRIQTFPTEHLKIEPWIINGWQTYGTFNENPGLGIQVLYRPRGWLSLLSNDYWGYDTLGQPARQRFHTDNSVEVKYYDAPSRLVDKAAFSLTGDLGCETGDGVSCVGVSNRPAQYFMGFMLYNRVWLDKDKFAFTAGGGAISNPGRYLVLLPPINGATAASGTPYFTTKPGDKFMAWDWSLTGDYMPNQYLTWRLEFNHRGADTRYFVGQHGITPPGGNTGGAGSTVANFTPDLVRQESRMTLAMLIRL